MTDPDPRSRGLIARLALAVAALAAGVAAIVVTIELMRTVLM